MLCSSKLQDSRVLGACFFNLGAAYLEAGEPRRGLNLLQQSQPRSKADRYPDLQFNLAIAHNALGKTREASTAFLQAAHLYRSQGDGGAEGDACMEMSRCYSKMEVRPSSWTCSAPMTSWGGAANHGSSLCSRTGLQQLMGSCELQTAIGWPPCWILPPTP